MIYIGDFFFQSNHTSSDEAIRRHGDFNLIIKADDHHQAVEKFRDKITQMKKNTDFLEGPCRVYFVQLFELKNTPDTEAVLINLKSTAGDPIMPYIGCAMPSEDTDACKIYDWAEYLSKPGDHNAVPFFEASS